jgi:hypothetical protein
MYNKILELNSLSTTRTRSMYQSIWYTADMQQGIEDYDVPEGKEIKWKLMILLSDKALYYRIDNLQCSKPTSYAD